ncbi:hypothetical protein COV18_07355 [Candidatus Woesearchaeota archaeon CG10_big_fil_rev_8_21_14_0_10_37_12]|nr:MAG: hypothetical protein COV18_07355 [Candidatus Woesearchaeota archaeon CG10_big_fil_rev_8_21_14_0_10_37_12]
MVSFPFSVGNPGGLWALLALVPLIILYLVRPKPKHMAIPSLMFFMKSTGSKRLTSFLRTLTRDWLFLIQLLCVAALALSFAGVYTSYQHDVTAAHTVLVIDVSASSQVNEGGTTRFNIAVSKAKDFLGAKNTVILAKDVPFIALKDAGQREALKFLNSLQPRETPSRIGEAIILAGETLGSEGRVVVLSDFINTAGQLPQVAKSVVESKGLVVDFIEIGSSNKRNVGIVNLDVDPTQTVVYVKNYMNSKQNIPLVAGSHQTSLEIPPGSVESFAFATPPGVTKISLPVKDDFLIDNTAFVSAPKSGRSKILVITNNESVFLTNALRASGESEVVVQQPPIVDPDGFDVIIVSNVNSRELLPGTFEDLLVSAERGATVIAAIQEDSKKINYQGVLPITLSEKGHGGLVSVEQGARFTKNVDFGEVQSSWSGELIGDQAVIASVGENPVLTLKQVGAGKIMYYGIPEESEFKFSPDYPIFWTELIKFVTGQLDVRSLNFETGETLLLEKEQLVKTPSKNIRRAALVLDEVGVYEFEDRVIAVNLVNELESNVNLEVQVGAAATEYELRPVKETRTFEWDVFLLAFALAFLFLEVILLKWRGDL